VRSVAERVDKARKRLRPTRVADRDLVGDVDESLGKRAAECPAPMIPILISHPPWSHSRLGDLRIAGPTDPCTAVA
jgi:hypothetical protein